MAANAKSNVRQGEEEDLEIVGISPGRKPGGVVSVRLSADDFDTLTSLSEAHRRSLSDTLRMGLRCLAESGGPGSEAQRLAHPHDATRAGAYRMSWTEGTSELWSLTNT